MYWSAEEVVEVPPGVATVTSIVPAVPAGTLAEIDVSPVAVKVVAAVEPKSTWVTPLKPVPAMFTVVPPPSGPLFGLTEVTTGAAT